MVLLKSIFHHESLENFKSFSMVRSFLEIRGWLQQHLFTIPDTLPHERNIIRGVVLKNEFYYFFEY